MAGSISSQQNLSAAEECLTAINSRFGGSGIDVSVESHSNAKKFSFIRIVCPPQHWLALAKWMKFDLGVNYCSMVTGTHFPEGPDERGLEVAYHFLRQPIRDQKPNTCKVHDVASLSGKDIPMEFEVFIPLPQGDSPSVPSIQSIWVGADWNEKETWDLVGIKFDGHENMHRVLNPNDSPEGFHPLQKQHKLRYHDHNEMYDDAQGFMRKPADEGRVK